MPPSFPAPLWPDIAGNASAAYGFELLSPQRLSLGEEAWSWKAVTPEGRRLVVRVQEGGRLEETLALTAQLRVSHGLGWVVAALPTLDGRWTARLGDHVLAVFPHVAGVPAFGRPVTEGELAGVAGCLAALHDVRPPPGGCPAERFDNPFAAPLQRALAASRATLDGHTPEEEAARRLLRAEARSIEDALNVMSRYQREFLGRDMPQVITHGDPNRANVILGEDGGIHVIDWGEVALGPPERDLTAYAGRHRAPLLAHYRRLRPGVELQPEIFAFYALRWVVQEIADYADRLLFRPGGPEEARHAWRELQPYLPIPWDELRTGAEHVRNLLTGG